MSLRQGWETIKPQNLGLKPLKCTYFGSANFGILSMGVGIWDWYPPQMDKIASEPRDPHFSSCNLKNKQRRALPISSIKGDGFHVGVRMEGASSTSEIKGQLVLGPNSHTAVDGGDFFRIESSF